MKTAPYQLVEDLSSLQTASKNIGLPAILKTTRLGYDGKGQVRLSENSNLEEEYRKLQNHSLVYEGFVDFEFEVSVIAARNLSAQVACYEPGQNVHVNGILHTTTVPSQLNSKQTIDAVLIASKILEFTIQVIGRKTVAQLINLSSILEPLQAGHLEMAKGTLTSLWRTLLVMKLNVRLR